ncbi:MAG: ATP-binding cassette domain-containing protein [Candidatus Kariarchaeaceae archaeon]|jgi:ABC-2 type transport system ATP-binding protein
MSEIIVKASKISKSYNGLLAVDSLDLTVYKGECLGLLGPNGAGKSTTIKMLTSLLVPDSGQIQILGIAPGDKDFEAIKHHVGLVTQEIRLWDLLTVEENLMTMGQLYGMDQKRVKKKVDELIGVLHLEDKRNKLVETLSGGLKRRVNLAMGLIHDPQIVILDEPTPGLDPQSRLLIWEYIKDLRDKEGKTLILTTHFMEEADHIADRVAIIDNGNILVLDTPSNLKKSVGKGDTIIITPTDNSIISDIAGLYAETDLVIEVKIVGERIHLRVLGGTQRIGELMTLANNKYHAQIISSVEIRNNTLEDVFIKLTSRSLRD